VYDNTNRVSLNLTVLLSSLLLLVRQNQTHLLLVFLFILRLKVNLVFFFLANPSAKCECSGKVNHGV
jgi:hypothetical protein